MSKNWRALGPWFHRYLRMVLTKSGVQWIDGQMRDLIRDCLLVDFKMRLVSAEAEAVAVAVAAVLIVLCGGELPMAVANAK